MKKGTIEAFVRSMMILDDGAKTKVSGFAVVVDVTESARNCVLTERLYADDFVLLRETIERLM